MEVVNVPTLKVGDELDKQLECYGFKERSVIATM